MIDFPSMIFGAGAATVGAAFILLCETKQESKNLLLVAGVPLIFVGAVLLIIFV